MPHLLPARATVQVNKKKYFAANALTPHLPDAPVMEPAERAAEMSRYDTNACAFPPHVEAMMGDGRRPTRFGRPNNQ